MNRLKGWLGLEGPRGPRGPTVHILVDLPDEQDLRAALEADDQIVDMSWYQSPLQDQLRAITGDRPCYRLPVTDADHFESSVPRFIRWITRVSHELEIDGKSLVEALQFDDRVSLWWFNAFAIKHFFKWDLPKLCLRLTWLEAHADEDIAGLNAIRSARNVVIWANDRRAAQTIRRALQLHVTQSVHSWICRGQRDEKQSNSQRLRESLRTLEDWVRIIRHLFLASTLGRRPVRTPGAPKRADVAMVTVAASWVREEREDEVSIHNRYLEDTRQRLEEAGLNVVSLPACAGGPTLRYFQELTSGTDAIDWDQFSYSVPALFNAAFWLARTRLRLVPRLKSMSGHPHFHWAGVDMSDWWLFELCGFLGDISFQNLFLYETLRFSLERLQPAVLLYKDEFYESGRAITLAAPVRTHTLPFQHATIFRDHLVYVHDPEVVGPEKAHLKDVSLLPAPDRFLAYGNWVTEMMAPGWPADRTATIGSLRHDQLFERAETLLSDVDGIRSRHRLPNDRPVLLIAVQQPAELERWIRQLVAALEAEAMEAHIVIKMHWQHRVHELATRVFRALQWDDYSLFDEHLDELMAVSDVMLTSTSTTGLEAAVMELPMICFTNPKAYEPFPYVSGGFARGAWDIDSMSAALQEVLTPGYRERWLPQAKEFVQQHLSPSEGHAVDALVEMVQDLLATREPETHT